MFDDIFKRKKFIPGAPEVYGFRADGDMRRYDTKIMDGEFDLHIYLDKSGNVDTKVFEAESGDEYVLYKTDAVGAYVGDIRSAVHSVLENIADRCCETAVFSTRQAGVLIEYVRKKYGDELEFLWEKFPDNAIWRRKDNNKWYGALLTVAGNKIGLNTEDPVEIVDLRMEPDEKEVVLEKKDHYPGWHMNKDHWYTVVLDAGLPDEELCAELDASYRLA